MDAGAVLRTARHRACLSQRALAARARTSHPTIAAYEAGRVTPGVDTLDRLLRATGVDAVVELRPRVDESRQARGDELAAALELAAQFPVRHTRELRAPRFDRP